MKKIFLLLLVMATLQTTEAQQDSGRVLRHVVLFRFAPAASAADITKVEDAFRALPASIKEIKGFESGMNNSPEKLNQGFSHCFFLTFTSEKDRDAYLVHPSHKAFGASLGSLVEKVLVVDYWADK